MGSLVVDMDGFRYKLVGKGVKLIDVMDDII